MKTKRKKERGETYIRDGRAPIPAKEATSIIMSSIKGKDTTPELILRKALRKAGMSGYRVHWKKIPGRPDICYPGRKIAIFVNGCFWHRCPYCELPLPKAHKDYWENKFKKNVERDKRKVRELKENNWKVVTVWECELGTKTSSILKKIRRLHKKPIKILRN